MRKSTRTFWVVLLLGGILFPVHPALANPLPLGKVPVPEPANLSRFVQDRDAAIRLGKALFWDMQAGSDGVQACASCHFAAGADNRLTNQLHPGPALAPAALPAFEIGSGPNYTLLAAADFPFFQVSPVDGRLGIDPATGLPLDDNVSILRNSNDIGGSQGISLADFLAINAGSAVDSGAAKPSPVFLGSRQVTGRNAPSVINAIFNYTNFWDGRAHNSFNGENPLGPLDVNAGIWVDDGVSATLVKQRVEITNASLASQATGPPLSEVEMSFAGRSFPDLARKMLSLTPLGLQLVHPSDGVLGALARSTLQDGSPAGEPGLATTYREMIEQAFQPGLWNSGKGAPGGATQMEANFSLFWGLALQLYQATLVSDRTPFDRFLAGNADSLSLAAQSGFATFTEKCALCHAGSELTSAVVGGSAGNTPFCLAPECNPVAFLDNSSHSLIKPDPDPASFEPRLADAGFFNIGVRPSAEDPGRGGGPADGFPFPLSFSRLAQLPGLPFATPKLPAGSSASTPVAVDGAFKTPGLRNVELTAPYFHNGSVFTLEQVLEFYTRGGNFPGNPELSVAMEPIRSLRGNAQKRAELVEFMMALTDERVRNETAPFDHPQLLIPSGDPAHGMITLPATGGGPPPLAPSLAVDPFAPSTIFTGRTFSGTVTELSTVEVQVNGLAPLFASVAGGLWSVPVTGLPVGANGISFSATSPSGGSRSLSLPLTVLPVATVKGLPSGGGTAQTGATLSVGGAGVASYRYSLDSGDFGADVPVATPIVLSGLADGTHTVRVLGMDAAGNRQPPESATTSSWTVKATPPVLTLTPPGPATRVNSLTIGGSVELGSIPSVTLNTPAKAGPVKTIGGDGIASWSCTITGLVEGDNTVTVTARDSVFNSTTVTSTLTLDTVAPQLTLAPVSTPVRGPDQGLTGSVEPGITPRVQVAGPAQAGPVTVTGAAWSCLVSGLAPGLNDITVTASDPAGNLSAASAGIEIVLPDGSFKGTGVAELSDALVALRVSVGLVQPSPADLLHGDVAPLVNGVPAPDNRIDLADALAILRKVVGLVSF